MPEVPEKTTPEPVVVETPEVRDLPAEKPVQLPPQDLPDQPETPVSTSTPTEAEPLTPMAPYVDTEAPIMKTQPETGSPPAPEVLSEPVAPVVPDRPKPVAQAVTKPESSSTA